MKVSELTGARLALWVGRAVGADFGPDCDQGSEIIIGGHSGRRMEIYAPHEDWSQGGPLLDNLDVAFMRGAATGEICAFVGPVGASEFDDDWIVGPTRLVAACRAIVAHRFGESVSDATAA